MDGRIHFCVSITISNATMQNFIIFYLFGNILKSNDVFFRVDFLNVTPFFIDGLTIIILIIFKPKVVSCMTIQCVCPFCLSVFQWQTCENAFQRCSTWAIFCWLDKNYKNYLNRPLSEENISAGMWTWKLARAPINPLFVLFLVLLCSYTVQPYSVVVQCKHKKYYPTLCLSGCCRCPGRCRPVIHAKETKCQLLFQVSSCSLSNVLDTI